ncbi:hypothetical protein [Saccharomonospora saliphila]|uniref:hypothetical protein n=1 Tax=Saccharomonospora saliphila TaxID=369829 RepID=UPI00048D8A68|nr:hypothetical protein [Saccharomonospora saliphila]
MSPKRGDEVAPPPSGDEWKIRYGDKQAIDGWRELHAAAPGNLRKAWELMRHCPGSEASMSPLRHHRLKFDLATGTHNGRALPQWQIEVTGSGRVWYLVDAENRTVWIKYAGVGHPRVTD